MAGAVLLITEGLRVFSTTQGTFDMCRASILAAQHAAFSPAFGWSLTPLNAPSAAQVAGFLLYFITLLSAFRKT
ncbi:hypothetical protein HK14_07935 [Acetobacter cibinongensis]|uniref:Uncharacterized protein n=1 Tax=Acetobacter cibinongensis TaxID=146475 RepID=A0A1Z5YTV4_9PROT|nr:hypothetical protein HK14_07935 [Acetobacter cibinongensis]